MTMINERKLVVVSGPSGCGKDTIVSRLKQQRSDIRQSVSCTTRAPREGEQHGVNYYYI
ncbi:MAG: guanylate kinase, partial [Oscillospiraceae bacterium]|nr:guanylate kinase [Oscillospiraceae bacterium]